jgi:tyrosine-protein phosphatase SIW14
MGKMTDATTGTTISRRSTRLFIEEQDGMEAGTAGNIERESRQASEEKEQERYQKAQKPQKKVTTPDNIEAPMTPLVDFGRDLCGLFPSTAEDMVDHGMALLQRSLKRTS